MIDHIYCPGDPTPIRELVIDVETSDTGNTFKERHDIFHHTAWRDD